jgi:cysteine synthase B
MKPAIRIHLRMTRTRFALYPGTTSVVPKDAPHQGGLEGFSPCLLKVRENGQIRALFRKLFSPCGRHPDTQQKNACSKFLGNQPPRFASLVCENKEAGRALLPPLMVTAIFATDRVSSMPSSRQQAGSSILDRIGNTPLLRLDRLTAGLPGITLLAKAEWANPGGSVKDRAAAAMLRDARARSRLGLGQTLLDATSGNTGIALAMLGAALGIPVHLAMPSNVSPERKRILRAYGATVDWTDPAQSSDGAILRARELAGNDSRFCYLDQYSNDANWLAHFHGTGHEIWRQTGGRVTHFLAGLGTGGTFVGVGRRLKEFNPAIQLISIQPDSPFHGLEGLKFMSASIVPAIFDAQLANRNVGIETEAAYAMAKELARREGLLVGISGAAAVEAAMRVAHQEVAAHREAVLVTVLADSADKYLSERFWEES